MNSSNKKLKKYAELLNDAAPKGEFLAFINPQESELLKRNGALGLLTDFGIPSYRGDDAYGGGSSSSSNSSSGGGGDGGGRESYGAGGQYSGGGTTSAPTSSGGDGQIDVGFQEALKEQAKKQADPVFGDPDPYVDVPISERDTITSFLDNYAANVKANPLMLGTTGALTTLYQTEQAKKMLLDTPGYEFLNDYSISDDTPIGGDGDSREVITGLVSQLPYTLTGTTPQESMVNQYFANLNLGQALSSDLQTSYNNAKNNVNSLLGITPTSQQFGYSTQPYGLLSSTNLAANPFNIDYLRTRGLI
jgi:hypothetical protein